MVRAALIAVLLVGSGQAGEVREAQADVRGTLRVGVLPLELESSSDTPLFGGTVDDAVRGYNAMAKARGMSTRIDAGDLGVAETLVVLAPGFETGAGPHPEGAGSPGSSLAYFFRLEGMLGRGSDLTSVGVGVYPLNLQARLHRSATAYLSVGGTASWLDRSGSGDVGALLTGRAAIGARFARHFVAELGYSAFAFGGTVNRDRLAEMQMDETIDQAALQDTISVGEASGLVDFSLGVTF